MPRGVQHHFNDAFDVAVRRLKAAYIHPEAARDRGAHLAGIQPFALDFAAFHDVFGKRFEDGLLLKREPQSFHVADQAALLMADRSQRLLKLLPVPSKPGPVAKLMDLALFSPHIMR